MKSIPSPRSHRHPGNANDAISLLAIASGPTLAHLATLDVPLLLTSDWQHGLRLAPGFPIVLYDYARPHPDWRHAVSALASLPQRPAVILLAPSRPEGLRSAAIAAGTYELLKIPATIEEAHRLLRQAAQHWRANAALRGAALPLRAQKPQAGTAI